MASDHPVAARGPATSPVRAQLVRELALAEPERPVLSVHLRTDPRDPANTNHVPGWLVALRNGLRAAGDRADARGTREDRLALRALAPVVEEVLVDLTPADRGRGVSCFAEAGGRGPRVLTHQLAPRRDVVRWDRRPFVSPLLDIATRGLATGLMLVGADSVRLLHWEAGRVVEPERSMYELELGDWREYAAYAVANPARGQQTATHAEAYEKRVDDWRRRFLRDAAAATARRTRELGWGRLLVAGEQPLPSSFVAALPTDAAAHVTGEADVNVLGLPAAEVAERLGPHLEDAARAAARETLRAVLDGAAAGQPVAMGPADVLPALAEHRVAHLLVDLDAPVATHGLATVALSVLEGAEGDMVAERAVELAVAGGAGVTTLDGDALDGARGMVALLRY
jgi:hypothetical protein